MIEGSHILDLINSWQWHIHNWHIVQYCKISIWKPKLSGYIYGRHPHQPAPTSREKDIRGRETMELYSKNATGILT